jgi:hypothetical protein
VTNDNPDDPPPSAWASLGPVEQAREWEEFRPGTFEQVFEFVRHEADYRREILEQSAKHERRLDYIAVAIQILTPLLALVAVAIMAWTAKYYADHGAASDGVKIFGVGAGSIVAAFLGVNVSPISKRLRSRTNQKRSIRKDPPFHLSASREAKPKQGTRNRGSR